MKLATFVLLIASLPVQASIIDIDIDGEITTGIYQGQPISLSFQLDTSKPTGGGSNWNGSAYYEWAVSGDNWMEAQYSIGQTSFDFSVTSFTTEGLLVQDQQLGAASDYMSLFYEGRGFTPLTPFIDGYADALMRRGSILVALSNSPNFISGLGKEQTFELTRDTLGTGRLGISTSLVHLYDGHNYYSRDDAQPLSSIQGEFNITSAKSSVRVPEPSSLALFGVGFFAWTVRRKRLLART